MIKILEKTEKNLLALQVEGKIDTQDYDDLKPLLEQMVQKYETLNAYLEVKDIEKITLGALWEEIKFDVKYLNKFNKIVVVGDASWKEKVAKATDLVPGLQTKFFSFNQKAEAENWVKSLQDA